MPKEFKSGSLQVQVGPVHVCAIKMQRITKQTVVTTLCWGDNAHGQLDMVEGAKWVMEIGLGRAHTCFMLWIDQKGYGGGGAEGNEGEGNESEGNNMTKRDMECWGKIIGKESSDVGANINESSSSEYWIYEIPKVLHKNIYRFRSGF